MFHVEHPRWRHGVPARARPPPGRRATWRNGTGERDRRRPEAGASAPTGVMFHVKHAAQDTTRTAQLRAAPRTADKYSALKRRLATVLDIDGHAYPCLLYTSPSPRD